MGCFFMVPPTDTTHDLNRGIPVGWRGFLREWKAVTPTLTPTLTPFLVGISTCPRSRHVREGRLEGFVVLLYTSAVGQDVQQLFGYWAAASFEVIVPQTHCGQNDTRNCLQFDTGYVILHAATIGEAIHVGDELQVGIASVSRIGQTQNCGLNQTKRAEICTVTASNRHCHVQAQHITTVGQEVVDEWFTNRQWVAIFARS